MAGIAVEIPGDTGFPRVVGTLEQLFDLFVDNEIDFTHLQRTLERWWEVNLPGGSQVADIPFLVQRSLDEFNDKRLATQRPAVGDVGDDDLTQGVLPSRQQADLPYELEEELARFEEERGSTNRADNELSWPLNEANAAANEANAAVVAGDDFETVPLTWEERTRTQEETDPFGVFQRYIAGAGGDRSPFLSGLAERRFGDLNTLYNTLRLGSEAPRAAAPGPDPAQTFQNFLALNNPFTNQRQISGIGESLRNIVASLGLPKLHEAYSSPRADLIRERFGADPETGRFSALGQAFLQPTLQNIAPAFRKAFRRGALNTFQGWGSRNPSATPQEFMDFATKSGYLTSPFDIANPMLQDAVSG